jgi:hypothetical protein
LNMEGYNFISFGVKCREVTSISSDNLGLTL